jgi:hypothetical protein
MILLLTTIVKPPDRRNGLGRIIYQYLGLIYIARRWLATIGIESLNVGNPTKQAIACRRFSWKQDKAPPDPFGPLS